MANEYNGDFQYDSCISRGICSINPRTSALQSVIVIFLKKSAKYLSKLYENGITILSAKDLILGVLPISVSNPEFNEERYTSAVGKFKSELPKIIAEYAKLTDITPEEKNISESELFKSTENIIDSIKYGVREFRKALRDLPQEVANIYRIILIICKSLGINLSELEGYERSFDEAYGVILRLLNLLEKEEKDISVLKEEIYSATETDSRLMKLLREAQEERYGAQTEAEVSYSTYPNKAVLVAGSNIRELETILEALKDTDFDIYTHDEMMVAHTFPKFREYKHLQGQYGYGLEDCLIDFATFPGAIILTGNSLHNIENFYRGRLFTTDKTCPKGVIRIVNNDYGEVIESVNNSRGFKRGKQCESVVIGYDYQKITAEADSKLAGGNFKRIFMIGSEKYSLEQQVYFEKLIKYSSKDTLIISFSYNSERENLIHINTCFDTYGLVRIYDYIKTKGLPITIFVPKCGNNTISEMINLSKDCGTTVYAGKCSPVIINPSLMNTLNDVFAIRGITSARNDLSMCEGEKL